MKKDDEMRKLITILVLSLTLSGCAAALVGGLLYKSAKSKEAKASFLSNLQEINLEREKAGLEPLNTCEEKYTFDPGWAMDDNACRYHLRQKGIIKDKEER